MDWILRDLSIFIDICCLKFITFLAFSDPRRLTQKWRIFRSVNVQLHHTCTSKNIVHIVGWLIARNCSVWQYLVWLSCVLVFFAINIHLKFELLAHFRYSTDWSIRMSYVGFDLSIDKKRLACFSCRLTSWTKITRRI